MRYSDPLKQAETFSEIHEASWYFIENMPKDKVIDINAVIKDNTRKKYFLNFVMYYYQLGYLFEMNINISFQKGLTKLVKY